MSVYTRSFAGIVLVISLQKVMVSLRLWFLKMDT